MPTTAATPIRSALFVDFDNIYINLLNLENNVAMQFASNPDRWLDWLIAQMPVDHMGAEGSTRRVLIRKCYLNPESFRTYRPFFIRAAFEVVDCPPLTARGKTSTDIHMVMDILDALNHPTDFNEFIILSGDADFTPVLLRLRKHDRRSVVVSTGYISPAYKAACDFLVTQDTFVNEALGVVLAEEEANGYHDEGEAPLAPTALLGRMAARLHDVAQAPEGILANELPGAYKEFPEFRQSNHWLGYYSLRRLTEAVVAQRSDLAIVEEDPWRVAAVDNSRAMPVELSAAQSAPTDEEPTAEGEPPAPAEFGSDDDDEVKLAIAAAVQAIVTESSGAVPMATLAQAVNRRFADRLSHTDWLGTGSFKGLLESLDLGEIEISTAMSGSVYDPRIHSRPSGAPGRDPAQSRAADDAPLSAFAARYADLAPLARKIHQLTDTPYLMPEHYALLLRELAREISERGYQMTRTSRTVRDRCVEKGAPIARAHVNFVLTGIYYAGYRFGVNLPETPERLGDVLVNNTINLCRTAQMPVGETEAAQIRNWIVGALSNGNGGG